MCQIKDVKLYQTFINIMLEDIQQLEKVSLDIYKYNKEKEKAEKKHAGVHFIIMSALFSFLAFVFLRMVYSVIPKEFPYYFLAPLFGFTVEYFIKRNYSKKEKKALIKSLDDTLKKLNKEKDEIQEGILNTEAFRETKQKDLTKTPGQYINNTVCLDYVIHSKKKDDAVINFEDVYNELEAKLSVIDQYEELKEVSEKIREAQTQSVYLKLVTNRIKKESEETCEKQ